MSEEMAAVLKQVVGKDVAKKPTLEQRSEGEEGGTCVFIGRNRIPGGGNSHAKVPRRAQPGFPCSYISDTPSPVIPTPSWPPESPPCGGRSGCQ